MWRGYDAFGLHRPVTNLYQGLMLRAAGLDPLPHFATLWLWFAATVVMLARVAARRGAPPGAVALIAAAAAVQFHAFQWSLVWLSTAGRALATAGWMAALLLHHVAVDRAGRGRGIALPVVLGAACLELALFAKEEAVVVLPLAALLEAARWRRLAPAERRAALISIAALTVAAAAWGLFRLTALPPAFVGDPASSYRPDLGVHWIRNLGFLLARLMVLPAVALVAARILYPAAWSREARARPDWPRVREAVLTGLGWALLAPQPYLVLGHRSYGYLYVPALGIAYAVGWGLHWAATVQAERAGSARHPALALAAQGALALALVAYGLGSVGWPRYRALNREAIATLERLEPGLHPGARVVFLDVGGVETAAGRSLFAMMYAGTAGSMARLALHRPDLWTDVLEGERAAAALAVPPDVDALLVARDGRLSLHPSGDRAERNGARAGP